MRVGDVVDQHEVMALVIGAAVHVGGQLVEVGGGLDLLRTGLGALAVPCPRRGRGEQHEEQGY